MEFWFEDEENYNEYKQLIFRRDHYRKEANGYLAMYIHEFGELHTEAFRLKTSCLEKKRAIKFCLMYVNIGKAVDLGKLASYLEGCTVGFQRQLSGMVHDNEVCKKLRIASNSDAVEIEKLYRVISEKLNPELNPAVCGNPELMRLWGRTLGAYRGNDLEDLYMLDILAEDAIKGLGDGVQIVEIPGMKLKMRQLTREIDAIITTDPYRYKFLFDDKRSVEVKKATIRDDIAAYRRYEEHLERYLKKLFREGVKIQWRDDTDKEE